MHENLILAHENRILFICLHDTSFKFILLLYTSKYFTRKVCVKFNLSFCRFPLSFIRDKNASTYTITMITFLICHFLTLDIFLMWKPYCILIQRMLKTWRTDRSSLCVFIKNMSWFKNNMYLIKNVGNTRHRHIVVWSTTQGCLSPSN